MPSDIVLRLTGITKRFGPLLANDAISLDLHRGEVLALLGENGAGKTTLMNILFGHYVADEGAIEAFGQMLPPGSPKAALARGIGMVHQHFTLADNLTVLDNVILGTEPLWRARSHHTDARARLAELSETFGLAVKPEARVADLSVGERQRVEILKVLYRDARILILDEPTAVLTPQETEALFATLQRLVARGLAIIFISHKLNEVMAVSRRVVVLRQGKLVAERSTTETDRHELAELMVGRPIPEPKVEPTPLGPVVLELQGVTLAGEGRALLQDISLNLHANEIVGIAGVSGNGQGAFADLVSGVAEPGNGTVSLFGQEIHYFDPARMVAHGVARIPEDRHAVGLVGDLSLEENLISARYREPPFSQRGLIDWKAVRGFATRIIADYDVRCPGPQAATRLLSGGNMQKLILGREMAKSPRIILANQPTRGLDIGAVGYVHQQLLKARQAGAGILLISEDLDELLALSDRVVVMYRGRMSPAMARSAVTIRQLGLMMAGHGLQGEADAA
ncbi:MAG TPA: ABC transporter ATP-binding protein [Dongiaceae bacterium]